MRGKAALAALLLLLAAPLLLRFGYVINELFVEYRLYPGLPFAALLLAFPVVRAGNAGRLLGIAAAALFAAVSANRSWDWRTEESLAADIIAQCPQNVRAFALLQENDADAGRDDAVINRHRDAHAALASAMKFNARNPLGRRYDEGILALGFVWINGYNAQAMTSIQGAGPALAAMAGVEQTLQRNKIEDKGIWSEFHYHRAMVLERAGEFESALQEIDACLELIAANHKFLNARDRIERRLKER
ncbi:MAG: hypothetical protein R3F11_03660 [Verrucomicrobiales bacterium]